MFKPLVALLAVSMAPAQPLRTTPEERQRLFEQYLVRRAAEVTRRNLSDISNAEEWQKKRPEIRDRMLWMLGLKPMPERTPLKPRITASFERDAYRVENLVFQSMPGLYVTGNLYLPKEPPGRAPAVLYLCGHAPGPWGAKVQYQHHGIWLARHGYVALLIDTIEFGEVPGLHHGTHDLGMWYWLSLGYTPAGPEVWNAIRAIDYLASRPEVDPKRIAVTGISGGGAMTWYTAAVDERVQAAAPVCSTWSVEHHAALNAVHENCDCIYFVNTFFADLSTVGALIAPRPLNMISASQDPSFPAAGYHDVYQRTRAIYRLLGAEDKVREFDYAAPHSDIPPFRKEANEWINRWIKNDPTPFEEGDIRREEPGTLTVLDRRPPDSINERIHRTFIPAARIQPWKSLASWKKRRAELLGRLKEYVFRAFPEERVPLDAWRSPEKGWSSRYAEAWNVEFSTEEGIRVAGQFWLPRSGKASYPALIYVKGAEDIVYPIDYDPVLAAFATHAVLVLHPRATEQPGTNYKRSTLERTAALVGATIESMQVWDILRAIDFLQEEAGAKIGTVTLYGKKQMGALALYAAALDDRVSRVVLDDPPASHWQGPALLNVLRFTDLAETAALAAPREIVSLTPLPAEYRSTSGIYSLYGKTIREAGALGDALKVWEHSK